VDAALGPNMLYVTNEDKPGFIGRLGTILGEARVNIATFNLGRSAPGADAVCLIELDEPIPDEALEAVRRIPLVKQATPLSF
jgi:D-3-phosphoglycerate dehydrogenase